MSLCEVKDFFQQIRPLVVIKDDNFHYFFYGVAKDTLHAKGTLWPYSTIEYKEYGHMG